MNTSAPTLFPDQLAEFSGVLIQHAQARSKLLDDAGHVVPVLCLDVCCDGPLHNTLHVEQPFPPEHHAQCEARARHLKKGMRVTVQAPVVGLRLLAPNAMHVHVHNPTPTEETT